MVQVKTFNDFVATRKIDLSIDFEKKYGIGEINSTAVYGYLDGGYFIEIYPDSEHQLNVMNWSKAGTDLDEIESYFWDLFIKSDVLALSDEEIEQDINNRIKEFILSNSLGSESLEDILYRDREKNILTESQRKKANYLLNVFYNIDND